MSMLNDLPPEKVKELKELYDMLMENEEIYFAVPWSLWYGGGLVLAVLDTSQQDAEFMNQEPYDDPIRNRDEFYRGKET